MILRHIFRMVLRASPRPLLILLYSFSVGFPILTLSSCSASHRLQTVPVETIHEVIKTDTLYTNKVQYDSIYVSQNLYTDRTKDTILIRQHDVEYRYKLLRDTIERVKLETIHDSIPYEIRIETVKEVPRKRNWLDTVSLTFLFTFLLCFLIYVINFIRSHWKP